MDKAQEKESIYCCGESNTDTPDIQLVELSFIIMYAKIYLYLLSKNINNNELSELAKDVFETESCCFGLTS
jgi:hypothetical protein